MYCDIKSRQLETTNLEALHKLNPQKKIILYTTCDVVSLDLKKSS